MKQSKVMKHSKHRHKNIGQRIAKCKPKKKKLAVQSHTKGKEMQYDLLIQWFTSMLCCCL